MSRLKGQVDPAGGRACGASEEVGRSNLGIYYEQVTRNMAHMC